MAPDRFGAGRVRHVAGEGGARLRVEELGAPDAPPLLLLHGGLGSIADFDALTPHLVPHFRLIGLDSRGHGGSSLGTAGLSYARLAADVAVVGAALGVTGAGVLGFSDGAIIGLRLAAAGWPGLGRLATIGATWRLLPDDPVAAYLDALTPASWRAGFPASAADYDRRNPEPDADRLVAEIRRLWLDAGPDGYPGESVRRIAAPLLVLRGDRDPFASRVETVALADRVPGAALLNLAFAGHAVHEDAPALVAGLLRRFLLPEGVGGG